MKAIRESLWDLRPNVNFASDRCAPLAVLLAFILSLAAPLAAQQFTAQQHIERPQLKTHPEPAYDVSSIIGFTGAIVGSVVVSFQSACAMKLVEAFAGMPLEKNSPD